MTDVPVIEASGLTRRFGPLAALDGVDLEVHDGESLAVFGPNGAGKTTLVRILTSSLKATSGTIRIAGLDPRSRERETRGMLGVISHQSYLYDDLSARDNLLFFAGLYGVPDPPTRASRLLESVGLIDRAGDLVGTFSRGMQQRLALARCLVHDPRIVFLDEPFTGLDPQSATTLRTTLERLRSEGRTLFLVTHNLTRGLELSDRWIILGRGKARAEGRSAETDPVAFEEVYLAHLGGSDQRREDRS
jgi:heme exporter protein A